MVIVNQPYYLEFGISPLPGDDTQTLPYDVNSVIILAWQNLDIVVEKVGSGTQFPGQDYNWNKETSEWSLPKANDKFGYGEKYFVSPQPFSSAIDSSGGGFTQYPHTLKYSVRNQVSLEVAPYERKCRVEQDGRILQGLNSQGKNLKAIVYMALPAEYIAQGIGVEVYDRDEHLIIADSVKNFSKGQLNARVWL